MLVKKQLGTISMFVMGFWVGVAQCYVPGSDAFIGGSFDLKVDPSGSGWDVRNHELADSINISQSEPGQLVLEAANGTGQMSWYTDIEGPLVYKELNGNFVAVMRVRVRNKDPLLPLDAPFSAAGFLIRDPSSASDGNNRWIAYNVGYQASGFARETKTTVENGCHQTDTCSGGESSLSTLYLNTTPTTEQELLVCRFNENFYFYYRDIGEEQWHQEMRTISTVRSGNGPEVFPDPPDHPLTFARPDMPSRVQVGVLLNAWGGGNIKQTYAAIDWVRFGLPLTQSDCDF